MSNLAIDLTGSVICAAAIAAWVALALFYSDDERSFRADIAGIPGLFAGTWSVGWWIASEIFGHLISRRKGAHARTQA